MQEVRAKIESFKTFKKEINENQFSWNVFVDSIIHYVIDRSNCFTYKVIFNVTCMILMNNTVTLLILEAITLDMIFVSTLTREIGCQFARNERSFPFLGSMTSHFFHKHSFAHVIKLSLIRVKLFIGFNRNAIIPRRFVIVKAV